jgi:hypothetical protein
MNKVVTYYRSPFAILINIFAVMVSWFFNHSIFWAIIHWIWGPIYLLYCLIIGRFADGGLMEIIQHYF